MRLATKLVFILVAGITLLLAIDGYFSVQRETQFVQRDMLHDTRLMAHALRGLVADVWRNGGEARALELIHNANRDERLVEIRWVWLDAAPDGSRAPQAVGQDLAPVVEGHEVSFVASDREGNQRVFTYVPIPVEPSRHGALELSERLSYLEQYVHVTALRSLALVGVLMVVAAIAAVVLGTAMVGRPLDRLVAKVRRAGRGDLSRPLEMRGRDELSELARAVNTMCEELEEGRRKVQAETSARIAALEQLRHADRLRTVGGLASGIAHELGTPLNVISERAKLISEETPLSDAARQSAAVIHRQSERMATIIRQLLDFARHRSPRKEAVDLKDLATQAVGLLTGIARRHDVRLEVAESEEPLVAEVDGGQIEQVLANLVLNAIQAMPEGGRVEVSFHPVHARPPADLEGNEGDWLRVDVVDQGHGIPPEVVSRLFEPFFTTKDVGEGTGLGLSIVHGIVAEHGGWIDVESQLGKGSRFSVFLPAEDRRA